MRSKLPQDAFAYYASLGPSRSYAAVATHFQVDKTTVVRRAKLEGWQDQIVNAEKTANARTQEKLASTLDEMNERHLRVLRAVLGKALETLRATPLRSASEAVRAIDMCVKHERVIVGEPSERTDVSMEAIIKREYERWMTKPSAPPPPPALPETIESRISTPLLEEPDNDDDDDESDE